MAKHASVYTNHTWKQGSGPCFNSYNPANGEVIWEGKAASAHDVNEVVLHAKQAFNGWANLTIDERSEYLNRFVDLIKLEQQELALLLSKETGKPLWESKAEISSVINKVGISLEAYGRRCAGMIRDQTTGRSITRHRPHGVIAVLGPFNFPLHLPHGHIIPALLAGNTIVFKPSELTPAIAEACIKVWEKANLPKGVLNLTQGALETGQALIHHQDIDGIFFTGSYQTGKMLLDLQAKLPEKILALEMGGNNPLIISNVTDLKTAAYLTIQSAYLTSGQRCTCARRLIVPRNETSEKFLETLIKMIKKIKIGSYSDNPEPYMGPLISEQHAHKILEAQQELQAQGGKILVEMQHLKPGTGFLSPGLMDVTSIKNLSDQEIFGPFLQLIWVNDLTEAITVANQTQYGLAAGLLSDETEDYTLFYRFIRAGIINWNTPLTGASSAAPFGGIKHSGNFHPSAYYAADYCSYPVASIERNHLQPPTDCPPGLNIKFN